MPKIDIMFSAEAIQERIENLAAEIISQRPEYKESDGVLMVGPLKGAVIFMGDLSRALSKKGIRVDLSFMKVSSYGAGTVSSGTVRLEHPLDMHIEERHVLLVDDIIDTGRTIAFCTNYINERKPKSLLTVTLLDKPARRAVDAQTDLSGFVIPDKFVVGYGTDLDQRYRELPFVGIFRR